MLRIPRLLPLPRIGTKFVKVKEATSSHVAAGRSSWNTSQSDDLSPRPKARTLVWYAISIASVGLALALASLLPDRADPSHFTLFFAAVMVSAWYGGLGAGLVATILSALSLDYFFMSPIYSIDYNWQAFMRLSVFSGGAAITSYLTAARRR